jgi:hypothetical protein
MTVKALEKSPKAESLDHLLATQVQLAGVGLG